jgi:hypothetical protein
VCVFCKKKIDALGKEETDFPGGKKGGRVQCFFHFLINKDFTQASFFIEMLSRDISQSAKSNRMDFVSLEFSF